MDFNLKRKRYWQIISKVHDMNFNEQKGKEEKQITDLPFILPLSLSFSKGRNTH